VKVSDVLDSAADRCEAGEALGGIDSLIGEAVGLRFRTRKTGGGVSKGREWLVDSHGGVETWARHAPAYSTSIDAAMSLVPEGWAVERWQIWPGQPSTLGLYETRVAANGERYRGGGEAIVHASAATPALVLCAAALRARAAKAREAGL
jgi:hypothetical protein